MIRISTISPFPKIPEPPCGDPERRRPDNEPHKNEPAVNNRIRATRVLVIDDEGNAGEFMTDDAIELAHSRGLDLIEVAPNARPPVCRLGITGG